MKYYSREILEQYLKNTRFNKILDIIDDVEAEIAEGKSVPAKINVRCCCNCDYFIRKHPTIETDGDFGYCEYHTDFIVLDDEPINWYFTDINGFCNEDDIKDDDR